ncbi:MAG: hypothetical protein RL342_2435, partial [Pseudomonadota bacterium]
KGSAAVVLTPNDAGCELAYTVQASVGGKVAQLGQRLIDGAAKSMAEDFFKRFDLEMQKQHPASYAARDAAAGAAPKAEASGAGVPIWVWGVGAVMLAAIIWLSR